MKEEDTDLSALISLTGANIRRCIVRRCICALPCDKKRHARAHVHS